jgi:hypothetical protein
VRLIVFICATALLVASLLMVVSRPDTAHAQSGLATVDVEYGHCYKLIVADHDVSVSCAPSVVNETSKNGRVGFTFKASNLASVSFSGASLRQEKTSDNKISQPIDYIIFSIVGVGSLQKTTPASGTCVYSDSHSGQTIIDCTAASSSGTFAARFLSYGQ